MLIEVRNTKGEKVMINPSLIQAIEKVASKDAYLMKFVGFDVEITGATLIYMHSIPTLSLSIITLREDEMARVETQRNGSKMFPVPKVSIGITGGGQGQVTKYVGETLQLNVTVSDGTTPKYAITPENIATVSQSGLVTFMAVGTASVLVTAGQGVTEATQAEIVACTTSGISIDKGAQETVALATGTYQITSTHSGPGTVTWITSNPAVATVDNAGLVTLVGAGDAYIRASINAEYAETLLTVTA